MGRYNAVFRLIDALRLFPAAIVAVLLPTLFRTRDGAFIRRLSAGLTAVGLAVGGVSFIVAPALVTTAYGPQYAPAIPVFRILVLAFPLLSLNYGLSHQLIGWGGQRAYAGSCGIALVVNLALNAVLVPGMGDRGAAWATLGTEGVLTMALVSALAAVRSRAASSPVSSATPRARDPAEPDLPRAPRP